MQSFVVVISRSFKNATIIDSSRGRLGFFLGFVPSADADVEEMGASSAALRLRLGLAAKTGLSSAAGLFARLPVPVPVPDPPATGLDARLAKGLPARLLVPVPGSGFGFGAFGLVARLATTALPRPGELAREVEA